MQKDPQVPNSLSLLPGSPSIPLLGPPPIQFLVLPLFPPLPPILPPISTLPQSPLSSPSTSSLSFSSPLFPLLLPPSLPFPSSPSFLSLSPSPPSPLHTVSSHYTQPSIHSKYLGEDASQTNMNYHLSWKSKMELATHHHNTITLATMFQPEGGPLDRTTCV